jgi:hypothetical protein
MCTCRSFDAAGGASVEANNDAVAMMTGVGPQDILYAQWRSSTYHPCFYLAMDRSSNCLVLSIRYMLLHV